MGLPPTGEIVARPLVVRACGCEQEFQYYKVDKYRAQRLAKFKGSRCPACVAKLQEEQRQAAAAMPKKNEALKRLPPGTQISLTRQPDGSWAGTLSADGTVVKMTGGAEAGAQSVLVGLARLWISESEAGRQQVKP
jgi:hypothetical protein